MSRALKLLFLSIISISCYSCFDIVEQIIIKKDGSGNAKYSLSLVNSKDWVNTILTSDSLYGKKMPTKEEVIAHAENTIAFLNKQNGIHNATHQLDFDMCLFSVSFDFDSLACVNQAIKVVADSSHQPYDEKMKVFLQGSNFVHRLGHGKVDTSAPQIQKWLARISDANYISIFKFEQSILSVSNEKAKISGSNKSCFLKINLGTVIKDPALIDNKIILDNE